MTSPRCRAARSSGCTPKRWTNRFASAESAARIANKQRTARSTTRSSTCSRTARPTSRSSTATSTSTSTPTDTSRSEPTARAFAMSATTGSAKSTPARSSRTSGWAMHCMQHRSFRLSATTDESRRRRERIVAKRHSLYGPRSARGRRVNSRQKIWRSPCAKPAARQAHRAPAAIERWRRLDHRRRLRGVRHAAGGQVSTEPVLTARMRHFYLAGHATSELGLDRMSDHRLRP